MNEINGILSGTLSVKLMPPIWRKGRHHRQRWSLPEYCEARHNCAGHAVAVSLPESIGRVERLSELFGPKGDFHVFVIFSYLIGNTLSEQTKGDKQVYKM